MSALMSRIMQVVNKDAPPPKRVMEINGTHPLIKNMLTMFRNDPKDTYLETSVEQLFQVLMLQTDFC